MLDILEKYYNDGLLFKQTHPTKDLTIWNYSQKVQFERLWDDVTLMCRGLVTNSKGEIIARPFKKFFNYEEYLEVIPEKIPTNEPFEVFEKMDGSLGILFFYDNEWIMATRGSFMSEQAIKGMQMLHKYEFKRLATGLTYLFEIIYNENRIVCKYDFEDLILLSIIYNDNGEEIRIHEQEGNHVRRFMNIVTNLGFKIVKRYDGINDYNTLKSIISNDAEGFVIRFKNGFRMKIKGEEYCRLHRIVTNISSRDIWESLKEKQSMDELLEKVPDEFFKWVKDTIIELEILHSLILGEVITNFWEIDDILRREEFELGEDMVYDEREYAKRFAEEAFKVKHSHLILSYRKELINPVNTVKAIWRMIRPEYQKPFKEINKENE